MVLKNSEEILRPSFLFSGDFGETMRRSWDYKTHLSQDNGGNDVSPTTEKKKTLSSISSMLRIKYENHKVYESEMTTWKRLRQAETF